MRLTAAIKTDFLSPSLTNFSWRSPMWFRNVCITDGGGKKADVFVTDRAIAGPRLRFSAQAASTPSTPHPNQPPARPAPETQMQIPRRLRMQWVVVVVAGAVVVVTGGLVVVVAGG